MSSVANKKEGLYQHLNDLVSERADLVRQAIKEYDAADDSLEKKSILNKSLIEHLDVILSEESWDDSLFLRNLIKPYRDIYKKALLERKVLDKKLSPPEVIRKEINENQCEIFILLYQVDGYNISGWNKQIRMLVNSRVTRPVYSEEETIRKVLRARLQKPGDAYLVSIIDKEMVLQLEQGLRRVDRYQQPLVYLGNDALGEDCFLEFVHMGNRYPICKCEISASALL